MGESDKIEAFYSREHRFQEGINLLRSEVLKTQLEERLKWGAPVYTINGKNVLGIMAFKNHFGIWFFNGSLLKDPYNKLETAQEKTKGMRHLRFRSIGDIDLKLVAAYVAEAIENQLNGLEITSDRKKATSVPGLLQDALDGDSILYEKFKAFSPYKQREFCEYIDTAKQDKTKISRLQKIVPMIRDGTGLNDKYRK